MSYCEDYPCCGHTPQDPCDYSGPTSQDMLADPARYHIGCDHNTGYCYYEEVDDEDEDDLECDYAPGGDKAHMRCPIHIHHGEIGEKV